MVPLPASNCDASILLMKLRLAEERDEVHCAHIVY
jgi:hypothetical protein